MSDVQLPKLNRDFALAHGLTTQEASTRPIRVIQFGEGNFLRAFVDWTIQQLNNHGDFNGNIAVVQPIGHGRVQELQAQDNLYTVILEGLRGGERVQSYDLIDSIGTSLSSVAHWDEFLALADNPQTEIIISNTTEAGIALHEGDTPDAQPPVSFPAKLLHLLKRRYDQGLPGFLIIPCELIANNGDTLRSCLLTLVEQFGWSADFAHWIEHNNTFVNTLVDRIVPGYPKDRAEELAKELGYIDANMVKAEPFLLWVIAGDEAARKRVQEVLPAAQYGIDIITPPFVVPYRERKVYLLNAPHTTLASVARLAGVATVGEAMQDPDVRPFIEREMHEEIIPVLDLPQEELEGFASAVLERYENPFVQHQLDAIGLNSAAKYVSRCLPLVRANVDVGKGVPQRLALALAGLLVNYGHLIGKGVVQVDVTDSDDVIEAFEQARSAASIEEYVHTVLSDTHIWGTDLTAIDGLQEVVVHDITQILDGGIRPLIAQLA